MSVVWLEVTESEEEGIESVRITRPTQPLDYADEERQQRIRNWQPFRKNWRLGLAAILIVFLWIVALNIPGWLTGWWR